MAFKRVLLSALLVLLAVLAGAIVGPVEEYRLKSTFLYNLCRFAQWPDSTEELANPYRPIVIAVLGKLPQYSAIAITDRKAINKRRVKVIQISTLEEIEHCHVLFIAASQANRVDDIVRYVGERPILTVGEAPGFCQRGVIINFFIKDNKLGFEFNPGAAKNARIQMDSFFYARGILVKSAADVKRKNP